MVFLVNRVKQKSATCTYHQPVPAVSSLLSPDTGARGCRFFFPQMQSWIDQAKTKLVDIIDQAKKDVPNLVLRVSFVG